MLLWPGRLSAQDGILETREFGRQYIELTRRYTDIFKTASH